MLQGVVPSEWSAERLRALYGGEFLIDSQIHGPTTNFTWFMEVRPVNLAYYRRGINGRPQISFLNSSAVLTKENEVGMSCRGSDPVISAPAT
jgi:hypothetical protein